MCDMENIIRLFYELCGRKELPIFEWMSSVYNVPTADHLDLLSRNSFFDPQDMECNVDHVYGL